MKRTKKHVCKYEKELFMKDLTLIIKKKLDFYS